MDTFWEIVFNKKRKTAYKFDATMEISSPRTRSQRIVCLFVAELINLLWDPTRETRVAHDYRMMHTCVVLCQYPGFGLKEGGTGFDTFRMSGAPSGCGEIGFGDAITRGKKLIHRMTSSSLRALYMHLMQKKHAGLTSTPLLIHMMKFVMF